MNDKMEQLRFVRSNLVKVMVSVLIKEFAVIFIIAVLVFTLHLSLGLELFSEILEYFGIELDIAPILLFGFGILAIISVIILLSQFMVARLTYLEIGADKIIVNKIGGFMSGVSDEVPYQNVVGLTYDDSGFINSILKTGSIIISLSGSRESKVTIRFVENAGQFAQEIQNLMNRFKSIQQSEFYEDYRYNNIGYKEYR